MRISFSGLNLAEGKIKYKDNRLYQIAEKVSSQKTTPFFFDFISSDYESGDAFIILKSKILDLLILDMEKLEARLGKTSNENEKQILNKSLAGLEKEIPLCDLELSSPDLAVLKELAPLSLKPTVLLERPEIGADEAITKVLRKSKNIIFYTANKKETRAWTVKENTDIVSSAAKIHSDLARGFIRAEVVNFNDFINVHNINEAKSKGLVNTAGKDYRVKDGDIIEIKFNV